MVTLAFFAVLMAALWFVAVPLFEGVLAVALLTPLLSLVTSRMALLFGVDLSVASHQAMLFASSVLILVGGACLLFGKQTEKRRLEELLPFAFLAIVFSLAFYVSSVWWPDFIALGERIRDYSLIVSASHNPVVALESWMEGTPLNYYVYWYRFGAMLHSLLGLELWDVYHALVALSVALYSAVCFQVVRVVLRGGVIAASLSAVLIPFGANVMGMLLLTRTEAGGWDSDPGWWGASRVVRGAITEFPAWSFLLGDAHPHYLNLATIPFLFLLLYRAMTATGTVAQRVAYSVLLTMVGALFLMGSNAWEVPMWLGLAVVTGGFVGLRQMRDRVDVGAIRLPSEGTLVVAQAVSVVLLLAVALVMSIKSYQPGRLGGFVFLFVVMCLFAYWFFPGRALVEVVRSSLAKRGAKRLAAQIGIWGLLIVALRLNSYHIIPEAGFISYVDDPIPVTSTRELLAHWGVHIFFLLSGVIMLAPWSVSTVLLSLLVISALVYSKAAVVLFLLLGAYIYRATQAAKRQNEGEDFSLSEVCAYALIVSGLGLLLIPEVVFLNDAYGGENERMNTIFKIYTAAWGMLGLGVAAVLITVVRRGSQPGSPWWILRTSVVVASLIAVICGTARFHRDVIKKRELPRSEVYGREGLGVPNAEHPGAGVIIRTLRNLPRGTVLEGQGNAYSYTTFVSTLAGQPAYMGWENHLNLLSKVPGEVGRRGEVTNKVYGESSCSARLDLARSEGIRYVVWGTIERSKYSGITETSFDCFTKVAEEGDYLLLEAR